MRWVLILFMLVWVAGCGGTASPNSENVGKQLPTAQSRTTEAQAAQTAGPHSTPQGSTPAAARETPSVPPNSAAATANPSRTNVPNPVFTPRPTQPMSPTATAAATYDAAQIISTYARMMLAREVTVTRSGDTSGSLILPVPFEAQRNMALKTAGAVYVGTLSNGAAQVALGTGALSGDFKIDIQAASLGAFSILEESAMPTDAASAFTLAKSVYPGVASFKYTQQNAQGGYVWYTVTTHPGVDPKTKLPITVAEAVLLGVGPGSNNRAVVWVMVGNGSFASSLKPQ